MPSVADVRSNRSAQKKYYNHPRFLQAPDPSALAPLVFSIVDDKSCACLPSLGTLLNVPTNSEITASILPVWHDASEAKPTLLLSSSLAVALPFPSPSRLDDIKRMEPGLLSESMLKRVGTKATLLGDKSCNGGTTQTRMKSSYQFADHYSPIARPVKRARTNSAGQNWFMDDYTDYVRYKSCDTYKRMRAATGETTLLAQCYTEHLIAALTKSEFGAAASFNAYVYEQLWRNIRRLLWDLGLSEAAVLLAFWYIHRLFPDGLMHPEVFTRSEGGMIAWRLFLLGNMVAEKWLEDSPHGLRTWQPYSDLPSSSVKVLEQVLLEFLDYNIYISNSEWQSWIGRLEGYYGAEFIASHSTDFQCSFVNILDELIEDALVLTTKNEKLRLLYKPESESCALVLHLIHPYVWDETLEFTCSPLLLRQRSYTTSWNPAADPIVIAKSRSSKIAPIARPTSCGVPPAALSSSASQRSHSWKPSMAYPGLFGLKFDALLAT